jgi:hypothetical protein
MPRSHDGALGLYHDRSPRPTRRAVIVMYLGTEGSNAALSRARAEQGGWFSGLLRLLRLNQ